MEKNTRKTRISSIAINGKEIKLLENINTKQDLKRMKKSQQIICELVK